MENFDTVEEWQDFFDERFPEGVSVYRQSDGGHFLAPVVTVYGVENSEPTIEVFPAHIQTKQVVMMLEGVEEQSEKELLVKTVGDDTNWIFSTNFNSEGTGLKKVREELIAERKKYAD